MWGYDIHVGVCKEYYNIHNICHYMYYLPLPLLHLKVLRFPYPVLC